MSNIEQLQQQYMTEHSKLYGTPFWFSLTTTTSEKLFKFENLIEKGWIHIFEEQYLEHSMLWTVLYLEKQLYRDRYNNGRECNMRQRNETKIEDIMKRINGHYYLSHM